MRVQIKWNENKPALIAGKVREDKWIVCESCGEPIKTMQSGIAVPDFYEELPASPCVRFFHKDSCDPNSVTWYELDNFFKDLQNSLIED